MMAGNAFKPAFLALFKNSNVTVSNTLVRQFAQNACVKRSTINQIETLVEIGKLLSFRPTNSINPCKQVRKFSTCIPNTNIANSDTIRGDNNSKQQPLNIKEKDAQPTSESDAPSQPVDDNKVSVTFVRPDGTRVSVKTDQDKTLYDAVIDNNVDIDGFGACEGTLCCTTCHLILKQADYDRIGEPRDEELDMLDLAYGLTDTSRLGCQVHLKRDYSPLEVSVPASINDVREG